jgi:hypothetical protein
MDVSIRTLERWLAVDKKCGVTKAAQQALKRLRPVRTSASVTDI